MRKEKENWEIELEEKERKLQLEKLIELEGICSGYVFVYHKESEEISSALRFKDKFLKVVRVSEAGRPYHLISLDEILLYVYDEDKIKVDDFKNIRVGEPLKFIIDLD